MYLIHRRYNEVCLRLMKDFSSKIKFYIYLLFYETEELNILVLKGIILNNYHCTNFL